MTWLLIGLVFAAAVLLARPRRDDYSVRQEPLPTVPVIVLCANCDATRVVNRRGRCSTCGSAAVIRRARP